MSKLQKWCPNYTQVCTVAKPGGCLYTVPQGTPQGLSAPRCPISVLAPDFLGGIPSANAKVQFCLPTCLLQVSGGQKLRGMKTPDCYAAKTETTTATAHQNSDKVSGNTQDSDIRTTGPTLSAVAPALEG